MEQLITSARWMQNKQSFEGSTFFYCQVDKLLINFNCRDFFGKWNSKESGDNKSLLSKGWKKRRKKTFRAVLSFFLQLFATQPSVRTYAIKVHVNLAFVREWKFPLRVCFCPRSAVVCYSWMERRIRFTWSSRWRVARPPFSMLNVVYTRSNART